MPEGPEVQIVVDQLNDNILDYKLINLFITDKRWMGKRTKLEQLLTSTLTRITRRGKYIIFELDKVDKRYYLINHLAMSGSWFLRDPWHDLKISLNSRLTFHFQKIVSDTAAIAKAIDFIDPRKFGRLELYDQEEFWSEKVQAKLNKLGPDTLNDTIDEKVLIDQVHKFTEDEPRWEIKPLLMEQTFLAGIGNIYASEICFLAGVDPFKKAVNLTPENYKNLVEVIPIVIKTAYETGGSTIRTYKTPTGNKGNAQATHMIYGKKSCGICQSSVKRGPQNGRTTYWCGKCQN